MIAGNVGGGGRLDFTVIGDAVNTAARIETATRDDRRRDPVQRADPAAGCAGDGRPIVPRASVRMKGKRKHVALYALDADAAVRSRAAEAPA